MEVVEILTYLKMMEVSDPCIVLDMAKLPTSINSDTMLQSKVKELPRIMLQTPSAYLKLPLAQNSHVSVI